VRIPCRALALVLSIELVVAGVAAAQSLVVRNAVPGSIIEVVINASPSGSAVVDAVGDATVPVPLVPDPRGETAVRVVVDACGDRHQVVVVRADEVVPPATVGCTRRPVDGLFLVRSVTSLALDLATTTPVLRIRQGPIPDDWFRRLPDGSDLQPRWTTPEGIVLSATGVIASLSGVTDSECGGVFPCSIAGGRAAYAGSAGMWFTRNLGAAFYYMRPGTVQVTGGAFGQPYQFETRIRPEDIGAVVGMLGVPAGGVRLYGFGGPNRHRATAWMTMTVDDAVVEIDDEEVIIPGGTQTVMRRTSGYGWTAGGGAEVWTSRWLALYAEGGMHILRGSDVDGGDVRFDQRMPFVQFGFRLAPF
jgi:hypothetical protein